MIFLTINFLRFLKLSTLIVLILLGFRSRSVSTTERRFPLKFEEFVQEKLMKSVNAAIIKVAQNFEQTLTLKSPETRSLEYQNFVLNANGDFISGTTFKL